MFEPHAEIQLARVRRERLSFGRRVVVLPAYNAATTLQATVADIPRDAVDEIILVDDRSRDETVALSRQLGLVTIEHDRNRGYGGNQKTCYDLALAHGADVVIMLHPDYQYDGRLIPAYLAILELGVCDLMLGSRVRTRRETLAGGMPIWKYVSNRALTLIENFGLGQNLGDFHSGFRVYRRAVLETLDYHRFSDDFAFDTQFLAAAAHHGFRIGDAPMPCRYFPEASSINLWRSCKYGLETLRVVAQFNLQRMGLAQFDIFRRAAGGTPEPAGGSARVTGA